MKRLAVILGLASVLTLCGQSVVSAEQSDVIVAGGEDGLYLLSPRFEGAPPDAELARIGARTLYLGNRAGDAGKSDGGKLAYAYHVEWDEITLTPAARLPQGEIAGRDRPTEWFTVTDKHPKSGAIAKILEAQLDALGTGASMRSLAAWQTPDNGDLLILEVAAALPDAQPTAFDGKRSSAIYLFSRTGAGWMLSDVLMSRASEDTDIASKHEVIAVGRDNITETVYVFVRSYWYEWQTIEVFSASSGGFWSVSDRCFGIC